MARTVAPTQKPTPTTKPKKSHAKTILNCLVVVLAVAAAAQFTGFWDYIKSATFTPTPEIETVLKNLSFTEKGARIARATHPTLEDSSTFNQSCQSFNDEIYVLGCYNAKTDQLHLFNIQEKDLDGIIESTTAHEMLHAVWKRLPFWERTSLSGQLRDAYNALPADSDIRNSMELYSEDNFYDELHSRFGTQVKDLPEDLEKHYRNYFIDQDNIVTFYESYNKTYKAIEQKLTDIKTELDKLTEEIDAASKHYDAWTEELNDKIAAFNSRIDDMTATEYNSTRPNLADEIDKINTYYNELNKKIDRFNELVQEYNGHVLHQQQVLDSMNSNANRPAQNQSDTFELTNPTLDFRK